MTGPSDAQLKEWMVDLEAELSKIESELEPLLSRRNEVRRQIEAVRLSLPKDGSWGAPAQSGAIPSPTQPRGPRPRFTPIHIYWRPTLEALVEFGGSAESDIVVERVGQKLNGTLTEADKEMLPSGGQIRWRNRVAFQRENMKRQGLIRGDSPRGIWEVTEAGREWLSRK